MKNEANKESRGGKKLEKDNASADRQSLESREKAREKARGRERETREIFVDGESLMLDAQVEGRSEVKKRCDHDHHRRTITKR